MTDTPNTISRSITFHRPHYDITATTNTEDPNAPVELTRPYGDGSGNEILISLSQTEWTELLMFVAEEGTLDLACTLERLERRHRSPFTAPDLEEAKS